MTLKRIRRSFGKTQREMADMLGISLRALQSYEQNWRTVPPSIEKLAGLLLFCSWRRENTDGVPCWEIMGCSDRMRDRCFAAQNEAGSLCWLVTGNYWRGMKLRSAEAKLEKCRSCPFMTRWLGD